MKLGQSLGLQGQRFQTMPGILQTQIIKMGQRFVVLEISERPGRQDIFIAEHDENRAVLSKPSRACRTGPGDGAGQTGACVSERLEPVEAGLAIDQRRAF
ncbi:MAG: hypothetical protein ABIA59_08315, partial [Candidatus Latescibacterota bacterium]